MPLALPNPEDDDLQIDLNVEFESKIRVRNEFPSLDLEASEIPYRIAFVGEAPGSDEITMERPFVGASGFFLDNNMSNMGILRAATFCGNLCQIQPPNNDLKRFDWNGTEIQSGLAQLKADLLAFKPNIIVLLGQWPLYAALGPGFAIGEYRGSLFKCDTENSPFFGFKCIATYHPANCLRTYENTPLFRLDLSKARKQGETTELRLPERRIEIELSAWEIYHILHNWPDGKSMSFDIEGVLGKWSMVGLSSEALHAFVVPWSKFTLDEHVMVIKELARVLRNPRIPKTLQNCLYDLFVMAYGYQMRVANVQDDTMLKGQECYKELPKGLDTQASIWTLQPQWKHLIAYSKKERDKRAKAGVDPATEFKHKKIACGIDCSVTLEISQAQDRVLKSGKPGPGSWSHYQMNMKLLRPFLYMQLRGIKYDKDEAANMLTRTRAIISEAQARLNVRVGFTLNMASPQQVARYLYVQLGLEKQFKKEHGRKTEKVTTDVEALLTLVRLYDKPVLHDMLLIRRLTKRAQSLSIGTDSDGRVRCGYNIVGTDTDRVTCYTSPTGSGENLQTVTKKHRKLYVADDGRYFFQCDLEGADGWTVAAHCAKHGDDTMLQDYYYGIKPARVIALMYEMGIQVGKMEREELKRLGKKVDGDGWLYFASKRIQHGTNYELGPVTMSGQILKDSYKYLDSAIYVPQTKCKHLQGLYVEGRYGGINRWKDWAREMILDTKRPGGLRLVTASGSCRIFLGRRRDGRNVSHETLRAFLSHEPQANTTYATNKAMYNLWHDPSNRVSSYYGAGSAVYVDELIRTAGPDAMVAVERHAARLRERSFLQEGGLLVEPQHQVHDALCGQFDKELLPWAGLKIKSWFNNPMEIAGITLTIPYDGGYGPNWGECGEKRDKQTDELLSTPDVRGRL